MLCTDESFLFAANKNAYKCFTLNIIVIIICNVLMFPTLPLRYFSFLYTSAYQNWRISVCRVKQLIVNVVAIQNLH